MMQIRKWLIFMKKSKEDKRQKTKDKRPKTQDPGPRTQDKRQKAALNKIPSQESLLLDSGGFGVGFLKDKI
jgi:hypothetical protein